MRTFKDVLQRWRPLEKLAQELGERGVTVRQWGNRNSIPPEHWLSIVQVAERYGFNDITIDLLARIAASGGELSDPAPSEAA